MAQNYQRDKNGIRFTPGSMNLIKPPDMLGPGEYAFLQNVRGYLQDRIIGRATQGQPRFTPSSTAVYSLRRLNTITNTGDFISSLVNASSQQLFVNELPASSDLSGNPVSLVPFRPSASPQAWMYVADSQKMLKVTYDAVAQKMGIAEPQGIPAVSSEDTTTIGVDTLPATSPPWTNNGGLNSSFNYGGTDAASPIIIATPAVGSQVILTVAGSATVNGAVHAAGDAGSGASGFPGAFVTGPSIVLGAFTDNTGQIVPSTSPPAVINIGSSTSLTVPAGATRLQIGTNSQGGTYSSNSGSFAVAWTIKASAVTTAVSTIGNVTAYVWGTPPPAGGGSPHSGPVASYIWKNPGDTGSGVPRSLTDPVPDASPTNNSWHFDSSPENGTVAVQWNTLNADGTVAGAIPLFDPALESEGFEDFNCCIVGSIFVPAAGEYPFIVTNKDQLLFGIGGGATIAGGFVKAPNFAQTKTVINGLPLVLATTPDGEGGAVTHTINVTFPAQGVYQMEANWNYWFHSGRKLIITLNGADIPPLPQGVRSQTSYVYVYRSSTTGATSNPSPPSIPTNLPELNATITPLWSPDPQVDKVDYYRQDSGLANYTYVATGPNTNPPTPIVDTLSDLAAANNPLLQFDNFEPFPSIDLPRAGTLSVEAGVLTWISGDLFNTRWLPGTVILIGAPTQLAYTLVTRPISTTVIEIPGVPDAGGVVWNIAEPILAAQPLPSMWGPTDNTAYMFACGDPLRPGTIYFTKGNNPDSAPDTNQIEITSPSEPLINGCIVNGISMVFSSDRAWIGEPTFSTALATVSGVAGSAFNFTESISNRGLYARNCICTDGGKTVFFRGKDGIYASNGGAGSQSITDATIYNLFPHEGVLPRPVTVFSLNGTPVIVFPPDDRFLENQQLSFGNGYLYYDYVNGTTPYTLVYDVIAKGWSVDDYEVPVNCHSLQEGDAVNNTYMGCSDGTIRPFTSQGAERTTSIVATGAVNAGDDRAFKRLGDVFVKAVAAGSTPTTGGISVALYSSQYANALTGYAPTFLAGSGSLQSYIVDFTSGLAQDLDDIEAVLSWATNSGATLSLWQPDFIPLPETTQDRPTDWDSAGTPGNKFVQGLLVECNTFGQPKTVMVQRSDDGAVFTPNESPLTLSNQSVVALSFTPPFLAHMVRVISTDGVPWQTWGVQWDVQPYPEQATMWQTEGVAHGLKGYLHIFQMNLVYLSANPVTVTLTTDQGSFSQVWPATAPGGLNPVKTLLKFSANKFKITSYTVSSTAPFLLWKEDCEVWCKSWGSTGPYDIVKPFGGESSAGASV